VHHNESSFGESMESVHGVRSQLVQEMAIPMQQRKSPGIVLDNSIQAIQNSSDE
jgi:hypothetical protein